ncbi:septal ring lytic transglycosylase RlpA family protein [Luedemannella helvata]|uniref:RlpA-like protein double-psi beta-barrel domain-containing protein n=1 Tax=Luedemannella helvata TaxID=349315 RepID=A0ABN2K5B2_9ACTN
MSDRYAARHGGRIKPRPRRNRSRRLGRLAATLTIAGVLVGGAGAVLNATASPTATPAAVSTYSLNDLPNLGEDRDAERAGRDADRDAPATDGKVVVAGTCKASAYDAAGTLTAAHRTLPLDTRVRVTNPSTGAWVVVRISDRGPDTDGRCLDLSHDAFSKIAKDSAESIRVKFEVLAG